MAEMILVCGLSRSGKTDWAKEEAEANRDKWVAFYASDEVLEV